MKLERHAACRVDRDEALRYLGYSKQGLVENFDATLEERIDAAIERCERVSQPMWAYRVIARADVGSVIAELWPQATAVAFLAATLGLNFDREARKLAVSSEDAVASLVFDAAGSSLVEACVDACENAVRQAASELGLCSRRRVSPGYGKIPLPFSADILRALDAGKQLGISLTEANLLLPQKSVTALVALFDESDLPLR